jgi:hypothetical protein
VDNNIGLFAPNIMALMPSEDALGLTNALRDKVKEILALNPYYLVRRDALKRQIEMVLLNASGVEMWSSVRSVFTVLALVAYYDTARSELPPTSPNEVLGEEAAQVGSLVVQARDHIPLDDIDNLVNAFTAIESVATVNREIADTNPPQYMKMLSPFLIIQNLQNYSSYYVSALPAMVTALTHGPTAPYKSATPSDLASFISSDYSYNYMNPPPGGWTAQTPNLFTRFLILVDRHATYMIQNASMYRGSDATSVMSASVTKLLEDHLATILLAGLIHKNRDAFFIAFPQPSVQLAVAAAGKCAVIQ